MTYMNSSYVRDRILYFCVGLLLGVLIMLPLALCVPCSAITIDEYSSNFILWNTSGSANVSLDGTPITVSGVVYGQYELESGTTHIMRDTDTGVSVSQTTDKSGYDYLVYWIFIGILFAAIITSYLYPISYAFTAFYSIWLTAVYLPGESASSGMYMLVGIGALIGIFAAWKGMRKL